MRNLQPKEGGGEPPGKRALRPEDLVNHLKEIYRYRSLIFSLVQRELKARYRGSVLGFLWTFLNPLLLMLVYALVFSLYFRFKMEHYAVFMFTGLLPWLWFSGAMLEGASSVLAGGNLVTKVLFPPQVLPLVRILSNLFNYLLALPILFLFIFFSGVQVGWPLVAFPIVAVVELIFIFGLVLIFSSLNVLYRDIQHVLSNLLTLWFFMTPILYPLNLVPVKYQPLAMANPMATFSLAFQDIFYYNRWPNAFQLGVMALIAFMVVLVGLVIFESLRESFAENI